MKKLLLLSAMVFTFGSCQKEKIVQPELDEALKPAYIQLNVDNYSGNYIRVY